MQHEHIMKCPVVGSRTCSDVSIPTIYSEVVHSFVEIVSISLVVHVSSPSFERRFLSILVRHPYCCCTDLLGHRCRRTDRLFTRMSSTYSGGTLCQWIRTSRTRWRVTTSFRWFRQYRRDQDLGEWTLWSEQSRRVSIWFTAIADRTNTYWTEWRRYGVTVNKFLIEKVIQVKCQWRARTAFRRIDAIKIDWIISSRATDRLHTSSTWPRRCTCSTNTEKKNRSSTSAIFRCQ